MSTTTTTAPTIPVTTTTTSPSPLTFTPLVPSPNADPKYFATFGRQVGGYDPANVTDAQREQIMDALYRHHVLVFHDVKVTPKQQFELTHMFDPTANTYGHGNNKTGKEVKSILHPDLKTIPHQPEVQLIGNGKVPGVYEGLTEPVLKHPHHKTFHGTSVSDADEALGYTRFYRWHIDAALYKLSPPKVTTLHAISVPRGEWQTIRYDDGTGDEFKLPQGSTVFVSGETMFDVLPADLKSLAVRTRVRYAPHPYVWMTPAHAHPTGLGILNEGLERDLSDLPEWREEDVKVLPVCWKNPVTGKLSVQVHPCAIQALEIDPLPENADPAVRASALYPDGARVDDLKQARDLIYRIQRPGIAPHLVHAVDWKEGDLVIFHNRGVLHSVTGAFAPEELRMFHQCNLAASSDPVGPDAADVQKYA